MVWQKREMSDAGKRTKAKIPFLRLRVEATIDRVVLTSLSLRLIGAEKGCMMSEYTEGGWYFTGCRMKDDRRIFK